MSKILILANHYNTLRIFRRELIKELVQNGNEVVVSIPPTDSENISILESYGCKVAITKMARRGKNPLADLFLILRYIRLLKTLDPDKIITYTIKPNIYGAIACRIVSKEHFINVTGLGSAYYLGGFTKKLVSYLYRLSANSANKVFFENVGNRNAFIKDKIVSIDKTVVLPGAGVNLNEFSFYEYPKNGIITILFVGRIMKEKGVNELFTAVKKVKNSYSSVEFEFIGWYEDDYKGIIEDFEQRKLIKYYGFQHDVKPYIKNAHCVVLPSYHEGMSNTLLESASMGRPLIASNIHGCMEAVIDGRSGFLCNVKDSNDLYQKIKQFIELPYEAKVQMGKNSRAHMESIFDKRKVVEMTLKEIN